MEASSVKVGWGAPVPAPHPSLAFIRSAHTKREISFCSLCAFCFQLTAHGSLLTIYLIGYLGRPVFWGGFFLSCSRTSSTAFSSWGSRPRTTSAGVFSTS